MREVVIPYFSGHQDDVFIGAYLLVALAALLIAVPIVFAPLIARMRARRPILAVLGVAAALAIVGAVAVAIPGGATVREQRESVQAQIRSLYGLQLPIGVVARLVNGDTLANSAKTHDVPQIAEQGKILLVRTSLHHYVLVETPASDSTTDQLPRV